jgi:hypothetical protein
MAVRLLHTPPSLAARGFTRRCEKIRYISTTSSFLPFLAGGDLQNKKNTSKVSDSLFFFRFASPSFLFQL